MGDGVPFQWVASFMTAKGIYMKQMGGNIQYRYRKISARSGNGALEFTRIKKNPIRATVPKDWDESHGNYAGTSPKKIAKKNVAPSLVVGTCQPSRISGSTDPQ